MHGGDKVTGLTVDLESAGAEEWKAGAAAAAAAAAAPLRAAAAVSIPSGSPCGGDREQRRRAIPSPTFLLLL